MQHTLCTSVNENKKKAHWFSEMIIFVNSFYMKQFQTHDVRTMSTTIIQKCFQVVSIHCVKWLRENPFYLQRWLWYFHRLMWSLLNKLKVHVTECTKNFLLFFFISDWLNINSGASLGKSLCCKAYPYF